MIPACIVPAEESDATRFIEQTLVNPETGRPFVLTDAERLFLRHAFDRTPDGRLKYPELVFAAPKKSGKTAFGGMLLIYVTRCLAGRYGEGYVVANDFEQSKGRVFQAAARIVEASPLLRPDATVNSGKIVFRGTGATITALASDYASAAGANPSITVFDELWAYRSERSHRLFDEMVPPPTRKIACRLTVTYAGFTGESELLEGLYKRGIEGEEVAPDLYAAGGLLLYWTHRFTAPWQTEEWREQMREQLRPNQYLRLVENRWVSGEESFIDMELWDACVDPEARPLLSDHALRVWVGVDASTKRDSTAIVVCAYDRAAKRVRMVWHRIFQPRPDDPLDFENTIETTLQQLARRFRLVEVRYDPYQMAATAQRLIARGIPMVEFPQTVGNLTAASNNLYELVKGASLAAYPDADVRLAIQRAVAVETPRGWKISKAVQSHKIDVVVALGMAALGAVQEASRPVPMILSRDALQKIAATPPRDRFGAMSARDRFARVR
jgi:phage terminase large subunit-like protein